MDVMSRREQLCRASTKQRHDAAVRFCGRVQPLGGGGTTACRRKHDRLTGRCDSLMRKARAGSKRRKAWIVERPSRGRCEQKTTTSGDTMSSKLIRQARPEEGLGRTAARGEGFASSLGDAMTVLDISARVAFGKEY